MRSLILILLSCLIAGCGQKVVSYHNDIQPILDKRCVQCHGTETAQGKIALTSFDHLMNSRTVKGKNALVVPSNPAESWLYTLAATDQPHFRMPPDTSKFTPLPKEEIDLIGRWIMQGAKDN